jgi:hypothetical protein
MKLEPKEWWSTFHRLSQHKKPLIQSSKGPFSTISIQIFISKKFTQSSTKSEANKTISTHSAEQGILIRQNTQNPFGQEIRRWTSISTQVCQAVWQPSFHQVWLGTQIPIATLEGITTLKTISSLSRTVVKFYCCDGCNCLHSLLSSEPTKATRPTPPFKSTRTDSSQDHLLSIRECMQPWRSIERNMRRYLQSKDFHW